MALLLWSLSESRYFLGPTIFRVSRLAMCEQTCHSRFAPVHSAHARFSCAQMHTNIDVYNWSIDKIKLSFFYDWCKNSVYYTIQ